MNQNLVRLARGLRLSGLLDNLELRLQEAAANSLPHAEFLELILGDEANVRAGRLLDRRVKAANFREKKTIEDFDFAFNGTLNRRQFYDLATGEFIRQKRDLVLIGPPGVGKSHLVQAIGYGAIKAGFNVLYRSVFDVVRELGAEDTIAGENRLLSRYLKPDMLVIDDMGMKQLPPKSGEILFEIIMRRYENRSTVMTTNRPLADWGKLLADVPSATAILDRLLHHAEIIQIQGRSYRLKDRAAAKAEDHAQAKKKPKENK